MGTRFWYPNMYVTRDQAGNVVMKGLSYRRYILLGRMLELNWQFRRVSRSSLARAEQNTGLGLIYDLIFGRNDVRGGYAMSNAYRQYTDVSSPTAYIPAWRIISIEPSKTLPWHGLFTAFQWYTWVLTIATIPFVGLTLYFIRKHDHHYHDPNVNVSLMDSLWQVTVVLCWDSVQVRSPSWRVCGVLCVHVVMTMFLVMIYMENYASVATAPKYLAPPINTFEQLKDSHVKILVENAGREQFYTRVLTNKGFTNLTTKIENINGKDKDIYTRIQEHPDAYAYIHIPTYRNYLDIFSQSHYRKFYNSKESLMNLYVALRYRKSFPYKESFARALLRIHASGLIMAKTMRTPSEQIAIDKYEHKHADPQYIGMQQVVGAYLLLVVGCLVAGVACATETFIANSVAHVITTVLTPALVLQAGQPLLTTTSRPTPTLTAVINLDPVTPCRDSKPSAGSTSSKL